MGEAIYKLKLTLRTIGRALYHFLCLIGDTIGNTRSILLYAVLFAFSVIFPYLAIFLLLCLFCHLYKGGDNFE